MYNGDEFRPDDDEDDIIELVDEEELDDDDFKNMAVVGSLTLQKQSGRELLIDDKEELDKVEDKMDKGDD